MRSGASFTLWSSLFLLGYLLHIAEEYWGGEGYSAFLLRLCGVSLTPERFLILQAVGLVLMWAAVVIANQLRFPNLMLVILSGLVLSNALTHATISIVTRSYNPGLISSLLIWMPLGAATLFRLNGKMSRFRYFAGVALGITIDAAVSLMALTGRGLI